MTLLLILISMIAASLGMLLYPLLRKQRATLQRVDYDVVVYRDQMAEIDRDLDRGLLNAEQAEASRTEIYRRVLAADKAESGKNSPLQFATRKSRMIVAAALLVLVPLGAALTYVYLGSPELPAKPYAERANDPDFVMATEAEELAKQLATKPDAIGFAKLGDAYSILRRFDLAIDAYQKALQLDESNANLWSELGEAIGLSQGGMIIPEARAAFIKALRKDPHEPRARFYLGLAEMQIDQPRRAVAIWRDLEKETSPYAPWFKMVKMQIARVAQKSGFDPETIQPEPPSLAAPDKATEIMSMGKSDQNAAIRAMVGRLATRLKDNPDDLEGWQRLAKSYQVLGMSEKAKEAESKIQALKARQGR